MPGSSQRERASWPRAAAALHRTQRPAPYLPLAVKAGRTVVVEASAAGLQTASLYPYVICPQHCGCCNTRSAARSLCIVAATNGAS
eukprot:5798215-Pleurochrysis_carterae.AAC.2